MGGLKKKSDAKLRLARYQTKEGQRKLRLRCPISFRASVFSANISDARAYTGSGVMNMKGKNKKQLLLCLLLPLAVGGLGSLLAGGFGEGYEAMYKPLLSPPGWVFPIVWTALYLLMGYASYLVLSGDASEPRKKRALTVYGVSLLINLLWPLFFFRLGLYSFAFVWLLLLLLAVLLCCVLFYYIDERAGKLLVPYLLWLFFAAYLNLGVALLN